MSPVNIPAILIANVMGITVLFAVAVGNSWRFKVATGGNRFLNTIFYASLMECIIDPICFLADGRPGLFCRILVYGCNTLLYVGGMTIAIAWVFLVSGHLKTKLPQYHYVILGVVYSAVMLLLVVNLFYPVVFSVDQNNVYSRIFGFYIYQACYFGFMLDGLIVYLIRRYTSGGLKFFPVWAFIVPALIGIVIQFLFYGVSTAAPFITISIGCMVVCLQNEFIVRDNLTGLYNRYYLKTIDRRLHSKVGAEYTVIMLDINGFKKINDAFGHKVGDEALIRLSNMLVDVVGKIGEVIRYAGDEFIIVLNSQCDSHTESIIEEIHDTLNAFNKTGEAPYQLSVAPGYCKLNLDQSSMDDLMDRIDTHMYQNKREYYKQHPVYDRRKR